MATLVCDIFDWILIAGMIKELFICKNELIENIDICMTDVVDPASNR